MRTGVSDAALAMIPETNGARGRATPYMPDAGRRRARRRLVLTALAVATVAVVVLASGQITELLPPLVAWIDRLGRDAALLFVVIYARGVAALMPGSPFALAAGALFGLGTGTLVAFAGA